MRKNIGLLAAASIFSATNEKTEYDPKLMKELSSYTYTSKGKSSKKPNYSKAEMAAIKKRRNKNKQAKKSRKINRKKK